MKFVLRTLAHFYCKGFSFFKGFICLERLLVKFVAPSHFKSVSVACFFKAVCSVQSFLLALLFFVCTSLLTVVVAIVSIDRRGRGRKRDKREVSVGGFINNWREEGKHRGIAALFDVYS